MMMFFFQKSQKKKFRSCVQRSDNMNETAIKMKEKEIKKKRKKYARKKGARRDKSARRRRELGNAFIIIISISIFASSSFEFLFCL